MTDSHHPRQNLDALLASPEIQEIIAMTAPDRVERRAEERGTARPGTVELPHAAERTVVELEREQLARVLVARILPHLATAAHWLAEAELRALARVPSDRDALLCMLAVARALAERDEERTDAALARHRVEAEREALVGIDDAEDALPGLAPDRRALALLVADGHVDAWVRRDALREIPAGRLLAAMHEAREGRR